MNKIALPSMAALIFMTTTALAADEKPKVMTIGGRVNDMIAENWNAVFLALAIICMVTGLFLLAKGLVALVATSSQREKPSAALSMILVGVLMISLPDVAGIGMQSLFGQVRGGSTLGSETLDYSDQPNGMNADVLSSLLGNGVPSIAAPENCLGSKMPAECISGNLAKGSIPALLFALYAMGFLAGFLILAGALLGLARSSQGQPTGQGYLAKIAIAMLLMNAPYFFQILTYTILGTSDTTVDISGSINTTSSLLKYDGATSIVALQQMSQLVGHLFTILAFFGAFAFVRGIFMLKAVAEGKGKGSYGSALVFMASGVLLGNAKATAALFAGSVGFGGVFGL